MRGHILVIDDERYVYDDLEFGLGKAHWIHYAKSLHKINSILKSYPIDLALVDLNIKVADEDRFTGLKYIKTLRERYPTINIAVLSQYSDPDRIIKAVKNGADYYLIKTDIDTDSNEFREQVRQWINKKQRLDKKRQEESKDAWGESIFNESLTQGVMGHFRQKTSFFLVGEPGLGKHKLLELAYRKSSHFKADHAPKEIDLTAYDPLELYDFLHVKRGATDRNFFRNQKIKLLYIHHLTHHSLTFQLQLLKVLESGYFLNQRDIFPLQLIILLDNEPEDLIREQLLSPELFRFLPNITQKPLRSRKEELKNLIDDWFLKHSVSKLKFTKESWKLLNRYAYPGNLTELFDLLKKIIQAHQKKFRSNWESELIQSESLPHILHQAPSSLHEEMHYEVARVHLRFIEAALQRYEGERRQKNLAAENLGVHSSDNLKKTFITKYWNLYPDLVKGFPTIMKKYKLDGK